MCFTDVRQKLNLKGFKIVHETHHSKNGPGLKPLMAIGSTVQEFAKITTIHGIAYIFDRAIKSIDKFLWFLIVCFGAGVAVYMSLDAWKTWKDAPVLTSVSSTGLPLRKIDFPAITICSQGLIQVNDFKSKAAG